MTEGTKRLVVVSNRLPTLNKDWKAGTVPSAGGLVSSLLPVMEESGRGLWLGWSGDAVPEGRKAELHEVDHDIVTLAGLDLYEHEVEDYYNGFCNRTLWPMFHVFQNQVRLSREQQDTYFRVNEKFSKALLSLLEPDDTVWVHDYHMVPLGRYLREAGFKGPMGFFLHIPFPPLEMIEILTDPLGFMDSWLHYDLVGFHTDRYSDNYFEVMERLMLGVREGETLFAGNRKQRILTCPIGIEPRIYDPKAAAREEAKASDLKRDMGLNTLIPDAKIMLSVDRLDYSKGIPGRIQSFEHFLRHYEQWRRKVALIQVCSPSRTDVPEYQEQKEEVDLLVGKINGEFGEHDWTPVRYMFRTYPQSELGHFYRDAHIGLVTPLRDGMNLVAMEYVAAQDPEDPGVLVLSRFTGVAEYLHEAVLVNPYLPDSVAEGIDRALTMSLRERKDRHMAMVDYVTRNTAGVWADTFMEALREAHEHNRSC